MHLYFVPLLVCLSTLSTNALEEYSLLGECDESSVPYKIEINQNGRPELYCTSTTFCFGKDFHSKCSGFYDKPCYDPNEWLGGLMELNTGSNLKLTSKCCIYSDLEHSTRLKTFSLGPSDVFTGGVFISNKGVEGFDLIKEVRRIGNQDRLSYEIVVVRMPCNVDVNAEYDLLKRMGYLPEKPLSRLRHRFDRLFSRRNLNFINDYYDDNFYQPEQSFVQGDLYQSQNQMPLVLVQQDKVSVPIYSSLPADVEYKGPFSTDPQIPTVPIQTQTLQTPTVQNLTSPAVAELSVMTETSQAVVTSPSTQPTSEQPTTSSTTKESSTTEATTSYTTIKPNTATLKNGKVKINKFMVPKRIQFKRDLKKHTTKKEKTESSSEEAIWEMFDSIARV